MAEAFGLPVMTIDLTRPVDALLVQAQQALGTWPPGTAPDDEQAARLAQANLKPRLRMTTLYFVANRLNYLVAGTGNRSEIAIGYYTKYGDGGVDLLPLGVAGEERGAGARARAGRAGARHRQGAERGPVARPDRRRRDGVHLRRAGGLPAQRARTPWRRRRR